MKNSVTTIDILNIGISQDKKETFDLIMPTDIDINTPNKYNKIPIFESIYQWNIEYVKALIEKGADLTKKFSCGQYALDFAKNVYTE